MTSAEGLGMNGVCKRILIALGAVAFTIGAQAADFVLRVDGIEGESSVRGFERWIDIVSFGFGADQPIMVGLPDENGRGVYEQVVIRHAVDKATPKFQEACMKGMRLATGELHARYSDDAELVMKFEGLKVAKAAVTAVREGDGAVLSVEDVRFNVTRQTFDLYVYWSLGDGASSVAARWQDGVLTLDGSGEAGNFTQTGDVPWSGLSVTNIVIGAEVRPKKNLFLGLNSTTRINGTIPLSLLRRLAGEQIARACEAEKAEAIDVENGRIRLSVATEVATQLGLNEWTPVKVEDVQKCADGRIRLVIPVAKPQGFYRLKTK